ncbi:MAG: hypothetical protein ACHQ6U_05660 [Thermodesulfobacteriota bacterium]
MNYNLRKILPKGIISLLILSFCLMGGCDVDFGGSSSSSNGNSNIETIQGTIVGIIPNQNVNGITVSITINNSKPATAVTDASGSFSINGSFAGSPQISFTDANSNSLGTSILNVFPTAQVSLGNITLNSGTVNFQDQTQVTFDGDVTTNSCTGNSGSLQVDASNSQGSTTVIVQISSSTTLVDKNGNTITCANILTGNSVQVQGTISSGNTVDAIRVGIN